MNQKWKNISRSCETPDCIPSNNQNNRFIDKEPTPKIFLSLYRFYGMDQEKTMSPKHKADGDFIPHQYARTKTHQPETDWAPVFHCNRWTVNE